MPPEEFFGFVLGALFLAFPMVLVLTKHQQKMAIILRGNREQGQQSEHEARMLHELASLRHLVNQQSIAIDDLAKNQRQLAEPADSDPVRQRLGSS